MESVLSDLDKKTVKISRNKLSHLRTLMYHASHLDWETILDMHAAIVIEIERGNREWGDSFWDIESRVWNTKGKNSKLTSAKTITSSGASGSRNSLMFCKAFQAGKCTKSSPHSIFVRGQKHTVHHICATCWIVEKEKKSHLESSSDCRYVGKFLQEAKELFK